MRENRTNTPQPAFLWRRPVWMLMPWTFLRSFQLSQLVVNIFQGSQKREAFGTKINLLDCVFVPLFSHSECPIIPSCSVLQTKEIVETMQTKIRQVSSTHKAQKVQVSDFFDPEKIPTKIDQETSEGRFAKQKLSHKKWGSPSAGSVFRDRQKELFCNGLFFTPFKSIANRQLLEII